MRPIAWATVIGVCLAAGPGWTAEVDGSTVPDPSPGWLATVGVSTEFATAGAMSVLPSTIDVRRFGEPEDFSAPDDAFGYGLLDRGALEIGPAADFRYADGRFAFDAGAYAQYWLGEKRIRLRAEALHGIGKDQGGHITLGSDLVWGVLGATASLGPRLTVGDRDYFRTTADTSDPSASAARFYAGATAALKVPINDALSATVYNEMQVPLSGDGRQNGNVQNTVGLELEVTFALPKLR